MANFSVYDFRNLVQLTGLPKLTECWRAAEYVGLVKNIWKTWQTMLSFIFQNVGTASQNFCRWCAYKQNCNHFRAKKKNKHQSLIKEQPTFVGLSIKKNENSNMVVKHWNHKNYRVNPSENTNMPIPIKPILELVSWYLVLLVYWHIG